MDFARIRGKGRLFCERKDKKKDINGVAKGRLGEDCNGPTGECETYRDTNGEKKGSDDKRHSSWKSRNKVLERVRPKPKLAKKAWWAAEWKD